MRSLASAVVEPLGDVAKSPIAIELEPASLPITNDGFAIKQLVKSVKHANVIESAVKIMMSFGFDHSR